jgi:hypothetical protein
MSSVAVVPILETSALMESSGFAASATIGVKAFIDDLLANDAVAVAAFDAAGAIVYPSTNSLAVVDATLSQLTAADAAVDALGFTGATINIGAGLQAAYGVFATAPAGVLPGALLVSTGQQSPGGIDPLTLAAYTPTFVCAPGPTANLTLLNQIATVSRGVYYYMPGPSDMQTALNQIRGQRPGWTTVVNQAKSVSPMGFWLQPATLASGLAEAQISVVWENAALTYTASPNPGPNQISITLVAPPGITLPTQPSLVGGGYCLWDLPAPVRAGQWYVQIMYAGAVALPVTIGVFAAPTTPAPSLALGAIQPPVEGEPLHIVAAFDDVPDGFQIDAAVADIVYPRTSLATLMKAHAEALPPARPLGLGDTGHPSGEAILALHRVRDALLPRGDIFVHTQTKAPVVFDRQHRAVVAAAGAAVAGGLFCRLSVKGRVGGEAFERTELLSLHVPYAAPSRANPPVPKANPESLNSDQPAVFTLAQAADANNIQEDEYGAASGGVIFSTITSCLLLAGLTDAGQVFGIHLALFNAQDEPFTLDDVQVVADRVHAFHANPASVILFGETEFWDAAILQALADIAFSAPTHVGSGHYGVRTAGASVEYYSV